MVNPIRSYTVIPINNNRSNKIFDEKLSEKPENTTDVISLRKRCEEFFEPLKNFVDKLISQQNALLKKGSETSSLRLGKEELAKANELISEDGYFGENKSSQRILDFAKAVSEGDKTKISAIKKGIDKGFQEAQRVLGNLPEVSKKTYDNVMKGLNEWQKA